MNDKLAEFLEKKGVHKWFKRDNFLIIILAGILIFIIALPTKSDKNDGGSSGGFTSDNEQDLHESNQAAQRDLMSDYTAALEKRLEDILSKIDGVGKVEVMITLSSSEEIVVEKDGPYKSSQTKENDSEGGSRLITQTERDEETVFYSSGNESRPYVVKTLTPDVEGVVVVAEGCGRGSIDKKVSEIVQALFGIEAHKVRVVKMSQS